MGKRSTSDPRPDGADLDGEDGNDGNGGNDGKLRVKVLDRAVALLESFSLQSPELGVVELAKLTGLSKGTVHRLLSAMEDHRLIEQDPMSKRYRLGLRLFELGSRAVARVDVVERATPHLNELVRATGDTANLGVLDRGMVLYIAKVEGWHSLRMPSQVGKRLQAHCTGLGKALLADRPDAEVDQIVREHGLARHTPNTIGDAEALREELAVTRKRGYAVDNEELEAGIRCVGAPVRDFTGAVVAAISVSGPSTRITAEIVPELAERITASAAAISRSLGAPAAG
jgi:DNA-binding IclR family transcriptional regulator